MRNENPALGTAPPARWRAWRAPALVLLASLGLTLLGVIGLWWQGRGEDRARFERECEEMWRSLQPRLASVENWMYSARDFCGRHVEGSREQFAEQWHSKVIGQHRLRDFLPGLYELGYAALETEGETRLMNFTNQLQVPGMRGWSCGSGGSWETATRPRARISMSKTRRR